MLDEDTYFAVCATSRKLGLRTLSVVNGTQIRDEEEAHRVVTEGPDEVSVSLDHPDPVVHDEMRGVRGSHDAALNALGLLLQQRAQLGRDTPRVYAMGLLGRSSYQHLDAFYHLVLRRAGADKLKLNAIQPTFLCTRGEAGQTLKSDDIFARESQVDPDVLRATLLQCDAKYDLQLNPAWVDQVTSYFRVLWHCLPETLQTGWTCGVNTPTHFCDSADRNIMVDLDGYASLCFSRAFRQAQLSRPGDLRKFWENAGDVREEMRTCDRFCGVSHSVRNTSATLKKP